MNTDGERKGGVMAENVTREEIAELVKFCREETSELEADFNDVPDAVSRAQRLCAIAEKLPALIAERDKSDFNMAHWHERAISAEAERDRLAGEVERLKGLYDTAVANRNFYADERKTLAAEIKRLTKERDELRQWHADVEKLYRDADARVKVLYDRCEAMENARIPSVIESAILHDRNRAAKHDISRLTRENATMREALESAGRKVADGNTVLATATIYDALDKLDLTTRPEPIPNRDAIRSTLKYVMAAHTRAYGTSSEDHEERLDEIGRKAQEAIALLGDPTAEDPAIISARATIARLTDALNSTDSVASALLGHFNPTNLPEGAAQQWFALHDQVTVFNAGVLVQTDAAPEPVKWTHSKRGRYEVIIKPADTAPDVECGHTRECAVESFEVVNDNGKRWRIEARFVDGRPFTMKPDGEITATEAERICLRIAAALGFHEAAPDDQAMIDIPVATSLEQALREADRHVARLREYHAAWAEDWDRKLMARAEPASDDLSADQIVIRNLEMRAGEVERTIAEAVEIMKDCRTVERAVEELVIFIRIGEKLNPDSSAVTDTLERAHLLAAAARAFVNKHGGAK